MNNIVILLNKANNGAGLAVVSCDPGGNPWGWLEEWFAFKGYATPKQAASEYKVVRVMEQCTTLPNSVITILENFGGEVVTGYDRPKKTDYD